MGDDDVLWDRLGQLWPLLPAEQQQAMVAVAERAVEQETGQDAPAT